MVLQKNCCITMCAPVCVQLQQEGWLIFMIINIYQFHLFSCTRCWTWISVKKAQCSLSVFSFSVCREHWVWLYKLLQFLRAMVSYEIHFLMSAAWSWTNYILDPWIHFKRKKLMAHRLITLQTGEFSPHWEQQPCLHVPTDTLPSAPTARALSSFGWTNPLLDFQVIYLINLRRGRLLSTWPAQMCKPLHFCMGTTMMC